jgi:hypothetical protein
MTQSGIEPAIFRLVARFLNQLRSFRSLVNPKRLEPRNVHQTKFFTVDSFKTINHIKMGKASIQVTYRNRGLKVVMCLID